MNVLLVHSSDYGWGGGQTAMNRLRDGLAKAGVKATTLCRGKTREDSVAIPRSARLENFLRRFTQRAGLNDIHCVSSFNIRKMKVFQDSDVIDLHCIHSGFFSYLALPWMTQDKPTVFTLHDMWPVTGHCHNSRDCQRWKTGCGRCPYPETEPPIRRDGTHIEWRLKKWVYQRSPMSVVVPSAWLKNIVNKSIMGRFPVHHIPHGIDTRIYSPLDRDHCRHALGIPKGKKVLLFAVDDLTRYLKGGDLLQGALRSLPASLKSEMILLLFGNKAQVFASSVDIPAVDLGYIGGDRVKAVAYSAADIFVSPTRAESFGLVILESMACGTPAVSFRVGGVPDLVRPNVTGYLAEPENALDLGKGIEFLLSDPSGLASLGENCRRAVVEEFSIDLQVQRYIALYSSLARGNGVTSTALSTTTDYCS